MELLFVIFVQCPSKQFATSVLEQYILVSRIGGCNAQWHILYQRQKSHDAAGFLVMVHGPFLPLAVQLLLWQSLQIAVNRQVFTDDPQQDAVGVSRIPASSDKRCVILRCIPRMYQRCITEFYVRNDTIVCAAENTLSF